MRHYKMMIILDPSLEERTVQPSLEQFLSVVTTAGGTVDKVDVWGRRRLAYEIDHKSEGAYHLLTFRSTPETLDEVSRVLKITDGVMRHLATRRPAQHRRASAAPTGAPPPVEDPVAVADEGEE